MTSANPLSAEAILANYKLVDHPLYLVGTFARGVTVYSQQVRAFNLVYAMVQKVILTCRLSEGVPNTGKRASIAIVGGGFAGLSVAAALIKKGVDADITIFEQRDTLLPLQHGSDTRWLHPRIYNWPADDSESSVADLPILNWTAARASDVAAQILLEWSDLAGDLGDRLSVYCIAQHLQIHEPSIGTAGLTIEWVGERRNHDGSVGRLNASKGATKLFDHVILAVGYGLEKETTQSYWRNDTLGQPSLVEPHQSYIVSGEGDGAMIEVLRLRISQYRQDRILDEVIVSLPKLHASVKKLQERFPVSAAGMYEAFENLETEVPDEFEKARNELTRRLRRDTDVLLHLQRPMFAELFENSDIKIAFQNRLLIYLLYKCGGFVPTQMDVGEIAEMHNIPEKQIIRRHGTEVAGNLRKILSTGLQGKVKSQFEDGDQKEQSEAILFPGGYFGFPGSVEAAKTLSDQVRQQWRKEYLPGPTALAALSLCTAIAGLLRKDHPLEKRLRVTLHRTRTVGEEPLLQQCCEYVGTAIPKTRAAAARTFPAENATIGLAYRTREIIRSIKGVSGGDLQVAMRALDLNAASREMSDSVGFVMAMPIVQPEEAGRFFGPSPVAGVLYIDSEAPDWVVGDIRAADLSAMVERFVQDASGFGLAEFRRIRNRASSRQRLSVPDKAAIPPEVAGALAIVNVPAPRAIEPFQLNFDYVDFVPA